MNNLRSLHIRYPHALRWAWLACTLLLAACNNGSGSDGGGGGAPGY
jgi:hypothetical protein